MTAGQPQQHCDKVDKAGFCSTACKVRTAIKDDSGVILYYTCFHKLAAICSRPAPTTGAEAVLRELKITSDLLYEFCEWFCDYDCEEKPCTITVGRLHERLEGIEKQMRGHPEYLAKWVEKRKEQEELRQQGDR